VRKKTLSTVSISGETTAPLPPHRMQGLASPLSSFNLRRDHRSLATKSTLFVQTIELMVSISGETTAPLPRVRG